MGDYNKVALRFSNFGMNAAVDPISLGFGQYSLLENTYTAIEGQLTQRFGMTPITTATNPGGTIIGTRRLNDPIHNLSTYICRIGTDLDCNVNASGNVIADSLLADHWNKNVNGNYLATGFSSNFGSICLYRPNLSNQAWAYVGDSSKMVKVALNSGGSTTVKNVGIKRPTGPATYNQSGSGQLTPLGTYAYRYTLYDSTTGVESLFNSVDGGTITLTGANMTIEVTIPTESVDSSVDHVRIYRIGGTLTTAYSLVTVQPYTGTTFNYFDANSDASIASATVLDAFSDQPFSTLNASNVVVPATPLPYLAIVNGYMLGCGDPNNPGYLYWSNKFTPDSQNPANNVEVTTPQDPLMNVFSYNGKAYVFSQEGLYQLYLGLDPLTTWAPFKTTCGHGLYAPNALCVGPEIYFLAKDGVYATGGGQERSLTDDTLRPLFTGIPTAFANPVDWSQAVFNRMAYYRNELWIEYVATDTFQFVFVYNVIYKRWTLYRFRTGFNALYTDEDVTAGSSSELPNRLILGGSDGRLYNYAGITDANGSPTTIPGNISTGFISMDTPLIHKQWGSLIFDVNTNGAVVALSVFTNKGQNLQLTTNLPTLVGRQRAFVNLGDFFAEDIQLVLQWSDATHVPIFYGYEILYKKDAIALQNWEVISEDHGIQGWQILRSGYISIRSDGDVLLTVIPDNGASYKDTFTYFIPNTGQNKQKIFIPFNAMKGKVFTYQLSLLDGSYFRLYNEDCEVHVKPLVTAFGYGRANPFKGGEDNVGPTSGNATGAGINAGVAQAADVSTNPYALGNPFAAPSGPSYLGGGGLNIAAPAFTGSVSSDTSTQPNNAPATAATPPLNRGGGN